MSCDAKAGSFVSRPTTIIIRSSVINYWYHIIIMGNIVQLYTYSILYYYDYIISHVHIMPSIYVSRVFGIKCQKLFCTTVTIA